MLNFFNRLRHKWFISTRTLGYTEDYVKILYQIYLNHHKVIHYRDGYPVYSLSTPALFSKPAANFFARSVFRTIQNKNLPNLMSFAINDICNAACEHCSFFTGVDDKSRKVMTLEQCQKVIFEAQELGVSTINLVGGEPLLREDLPEILKSVNKDLSTTTLFTNGSILADRVGELRRAGLDSVYISLDAADPKKHDWFRHSPGLFKLAIEGITAARKLGMSTGISCCITPESFKQGELDRIVELAKQIKVHEVLVFDALPTGRYKGRMDLVDNTAWVEDMIKSVAKYNQDESYPGVLIFAYATSHRSVGCSCGTSYFYVSPYGDIMSCDFNHAKMGNLLEEPLYQVWDRMTSDSEFCCSKWGGCKIKDSKSRSKKNIATSSGCSCG